MVIYPNLSIFATDKFCANVHGQDCIILLHGLARSSASMDKLETALTRQGYFVVNHQYASRKNNIQALAAEELPIAIGKGRAAK